MLPTKSFLRETVHVSPSNDGIELRFSVWGIELPQTFTNDPTSRLTAFFQREASTSDLCFEKEQIQKLILLLSHQGCLVPESRQDTYHLSEVKRLYISFCNEWYGRYYSHAIWEAMRGREIPISILRQWISRTYFLSRFAGVTASAASLNSPYPTVRQAFKKSAIEEYSHCQDYYYPPTQLFPESLNYSGSIEPLASFLAFDQQMLYIAKTDWLGHLFVALFQERTAKFRDGANQLYSRIEEQLGINGLFDGWRTHISYDEEHSHEDDLDQLFDQDIFISCEQLQCAFEEGALTLDLLVAGLSESFILGKRGINPRSTATGAAVGAHHLSGLDCFSGINEYIFQETSARGLVTEICAVVAGAPSGRAILEKFAQNGSCLVRQLLPNLTAECLSNCTTQNEIIAIGRILEKISHESAIKDERSRFYKKAVRVFRNHISSKSKSPADFSFAILLLAKLAEEGERLLNYSISQKVTNLAANNFEQVVDLLCDRANIAHYLNEAFSTISLMEFALSDQIYESQVPQFAMWHNMSLQRTPASGRP